MKCSVRDQKCAHLYHCWGSRRAARGAPGRPTLLLTESTKTFTLRSQTSGQSSSTMAGGNKTHTLCSQTSGVSQGPPQRTPSDPQGITKNAHPVQPNERGPPRTSPRDSKEAPLKFAQQYIRSNGRSHASECFLRSRIGRAHCTPPACFPRL